MPQLTLLTTFLTKCSLSLSHSLTQSHSLSVSHFLIFFLKKHSLFYIHFFLQAQPNKKKTSVCYWNEWHSFKLSYFSFRIFGKFARKTPFKMRKDMREKSEQSHANKHTWLNKMLTLTYENVVTHIHTHSHLRLHTQSNHLFAHFSYCSSFANGSGDWIGVVKRTRETLWFNLSQ